MFLIDLSNLAYRGLYSTKLTTSNGLVSSHIFTSINIIKSLVRRDPHAELVFALDCKPVRKLKLYPEYKANRIKDKEKFNPIPDVERLVRLLRCTCVWCEGEEADDVIASYCDWNSEKSITIVSSDSDLSQLIGSGVRQLDPSKKEYINRDRVFDKFGIDDYRKITLWKTIFGDSGDNIKPPIPRLKKSSIIPIIEASDGTVDGFLEEVRYSEDKVANKIMSCGDFKERAQLNYDLVSLRRNVDFLSKRYRGNLLWLCHMLSQFECNSLVNRELKELV